MTLETESLLERRRLRRRLSLWRTLGVTAAVLLVGSLVLGSDEISKLGQPPQIARIAIEGAITDDRDQLALFKKVSEADHVRGVLLFVNSPGGTTTGGESLYEALRKLAEKKPVVAQFGTVAASAGYMVGLGSDHIVARGNSLTGSVGVLVQWPEVDQLLEKIGVKMHTIKSGELKATPNPFEPLDDKSRAITQEMITESSKWFFGLVEDRRKIKITDVPGLEAGRVFSGREALQHKLIDEIGGEAEAVKWLESKGVSKDLKLIDWKPTVSGSEWSFASALAGLARAALGETGAAISDAVSRSSQIRMVGLDGLVSVWHPSEK